MILVNSDGNFRPEPLVRASRKIYVDDKEADPMERPVRLLSRTGSEKSGLVGWGRRLFFDVYAEQAVLNFLISLLD